MYGSKQKAGCVAEVRWRMVEGHERAYMPQQLTSMAIGCWIPPVVALARFYALDDAASIASVRALYPISDEKEGEDACEVLEKIFGIWAPSKVFS